MRRRARRFAALLLALLFAHLTWAGNVYACAQDARGAAASAGAAPMDDMGMSAMGAMQPEDSPVVPASPTSESLTQHAPASDDGCPRPSTSAQCQTMAPCAPMVLAIGPELSLVASRVETQATRLLVLTPPSRSLSPESPPPRA